jgi:tRNA threonylcarbamoyladenosine biosynthesis protein TsaB
MIDARRMEVYTQLFDTNGKPNSEVEAKILDENAFSNMLESKKMLFLGNGSHKAKTILVNPNALFIENFLPSARYMLPLANEMFIKKQFEDVAYFEPLYLKDFIATVAKNKVLGQR